MGQRRDTGRGKQCGSHVEYPVVAVLPRGSVLAGSGCGPIVGRTRFAEGLGHGEGEVTFRGVTVPVRASLYVDTAVVPDAAGGAGEKDWRGVLALYTAGMDVRDLQPRESPIPDRRRVHRRYDTVEAYIAELPEVVARVSGWYADYIAGMGRYRELPDGFLSMMYALRDEYPIVSKAVHRAEMYRKERIREFAVDRLSEYSEDTDKDVRSSSVRAAIALMERGDAHSVGRGAQGGVVVNVNIAQMLGVDGDGTGRESGASGEVVDAES